MSGTYDPRSAVAAIMDTIKRQQPEIRSSNVPGLVNEHGASIASTPAPPPVEGLCVLISAITDGTANLPADFDDVPMTRDGLKGHVRPDGGVCLGFYGATPADAVVVYGDPLMEKAQVKRVVLQFWKQAQVGAFEREAPTLVLPPGAS